MQTDQTEQPGTVPPGAPDRRTQIDAAARALREWIQARDAQAPVAEVAVPASPAPAPLEPPAIEAEALDHSPYAVALAASALDADAPEVDTLETESLDAESLDAASLDAETLDADALDREALDAETLDAGEFETEVLDVEAQGAALHWPRLPDWRPSVRWTRTASVATAGLLVLLALAWAMTASRPFLEGAWARVSAGAAVSPGSGTAVFASVPEAAQVVVAGEDLGTTPLTTELPAGRHRVVFRRGQAVREVEIEVLAGRSVESRVDWSVRPTGRLRVDSTPPGATVIVAGRERGSTPLTIDDLPGGTHTLLLQSPSGSVERRVTVTAGQTTELIEAIYAGFAHVSAPVELVISRDGQRLHLNDQNQLLLPPGVHRLTFENRQFAFAEERQVEIAPGATTRIAIVPEPTTLTVTATVPSEVLLNGERIGETSIVRHPVPLGTHEIVVRSLAAGEERRMTLTATTAPQAIDVDFSAP